MAKVLRTSASRVRSCRWVSEGPRSTCAHISQCCKLSSMPKLKRLLTIPLATVVLFTSLALAPTRSSDVPVLSSLETDPASAHTKQICEYKYVRGITGYKENTFWDYDRYRTTQSPIYGPVWTRVCSNVHHHHPPPTTTTAAPTTTAPSGSWVPELVCVTAGGAAAGATAAAGTAAAPATAGTATAAAIGGGAAAAGYATHQVCKTVWKWVANLWPW